MAIEIQRDKTKNVVVILASERSKRPTISKNSRAKNKHSCPFDFGNEQMTPSSRLEIVTFKSKKWEVRAMENKFPAVSPFEKYVQNKEYTGAFGVHEVIVETPNHNEQFEDLSASQMQSVFEAYVNRFTEISKIKGVKYVSLFKNHGQNAGASIPHEHSQIIGLPFVPEMNVNEFQHSKNKSQCAYCKLAKEKASIIFENKFFSVVCPYIARFGFECWVIPKKHKTDFSLFDTGERAAFMEALQETVRRVKRKTSDYNFSFHSSGKGGNVHFHVEIYPRQVAPHVWAGLELGTGVIISSTDKITALKTLR